MEPRLHRGLGQTPTCLRPSPRVHGSPLLCGSLWLWDVENGPPLLSSAQVPAFPSGQQECCVCVSVCVCVCVQEGKTASSSGEKTPGGPRGKGSRPSIRLQEAALGAKHPPDPHRVVPVVPGSATPTPGRW